jgi:DNA sulfur modification protein DndD
LFIDYITFKNYRQYRDENIKFPIPKAKKNFIILEGANGSGKTNILNAIDWCLYGEELHLDKNNVSLPIVNTLSLKESAKNCEVCVEIQMLDNEKRKINFKRTLSFYSKDGKPEKVHDIISNSPDGSNFTILRQIGHDMKVIEGEDARYIVQQLIPKSLEEYFLFDGEHLERYFKEKSGEKIKEEVFKISQLELLEKVIEHLTAMEKEFLRTSKDLAPDVKEIEERYKAYSDSLEKYENEREKLNEEKIKNEQIEKDLSEKLRNSPNIKELQEEREEIEDQMKKIESEIKDLESEKFDFLIECAPAIFANSSINETIKIIGGEEDAGNVPPNIDRQFLEKILSKGTCICGNDISKDNINDRKKVENLLKSINEISSISSELLKLKENLTGTMDILKDFDKKRINYGKLVKNREKEYEIKGKRLKIIESSIKSGNEKQINEWENQLEQVKKIIGDLREEIGEHNARIEQAQKQADFLKSRLEDELKKSKKYDELRNILSFCDEVLKITDNIKNEIMQDTRRQIEEITKKEFFNLIWKKKTWKDVKINDNYDVSVVHQSGLEGLGSLSRGETQALALAFVGALSTVSGFDLPIVIDTPLGRISSEVKKNIAENLPNYLENKQVIILMTDEEYSDEVRKKLTSRLTKEYKIKFKETDIGSEAWVENYGK